MLFASLHAEICSESRDTYVCMCICTIESVTVTAEKHVNGIRCMQSTLDINERVSARYELQSSVNTNARRQKATRVRRVT